MSQIARAAFALLRALFKVVLALVLLIVVLLGGCAVTCQALSERGELRRITSPEGATDAVLVYDSGCEGATGGGTLDLYVIPSGRDTERFLNRFTSSGDRVASLTGFDDIDKDLKLRWRGSRILEIHYQNAEVFGFDNSQYIQGQGKPRTVELRLIPPKGRTALPKEYFEDPSAAERLPKR